MKYSVGDTSGKLMIIETGHFISNGARRQGAYLVWCECGTEKLIRIGHFSNTYSCGCAQKETHGEGRNNEHHDIYMRWCSIKQRCYNINNKDYRYYGGKGITMCDEWRNNYPEFRDWALLNGYSKGLELDRENNSGPYSPDNCRWITHAENMKNRG